MDAESGDDDKDPHGRTDACEQTRSRGHKNRLSFICERARKAAKIA